VDFFIGISDNTIMNYGDKLKELRKSAGLSQGTVSEKMGVAQSSYSESEKRAEPPLDFLRKALAVIDPKAKLFEFLAEPEDLDKYIPSWILKEDLDMLKALYSLDKDTRLDVRRVWNEGLKGILNALERGKK
jgi:transcriptional regulator with XRE-family HTH domain